MRRPWYLLMAALLPIQQSWTADLIRGPYLQMGTPTAMTVRWRSDSACTGAVYYGTSPANLSGSALEPSATTEHEVRLEGLQPRTFYYYAVAETPAGPVISSTNRFRTFPLPGSATPLRTWILGDPGTGTAEARAVCNAYLEHTGTNYTDLVLTLGDNAYYDGTDEQFQSGFFDIYPELLRTSPLFLSYGNHDGYTSSSANQTGAYYDNFTHPTNGESGGIPSGTEAYYSFDVANAHFICLDSYESDRSVDGSMHTWLQQDLAACTSQWIIAYWHHAPYSKGTHDSDSYSQEPEMVEMRENFLPLLESSGADLVLGGHSHVYEQTYLLNGHYDESPQFNLNTHAQNCGNGQISGDGPYIKPDTIKAPNEGTVYVVAGASGKLANNFLGSHPAFETTQLYFGSMVMDIDGNRLDLIYLNNAGVVTDHLTMLKGNDDFDRDGMSDLWEQETFGIHVPPDGNPDGDSSDNLHEYIAGTNPLDAQSQFLLTNEQNTADGFILRWSAEENRIYTVKRTAELNQEPTVLQDNIHAPQDSYTDAVHTAENRGFYQVEVRIGE